MKIVKPSYQILTELDGKSILQQIEVIARTCYKSEDKITETSGIALVKNLIKRGHEAMIEHGPLISIRFIANRGFTHEIVRMRLASFAQESTRYCNYSKGKFDGNVTFCMPEYIIDKDQFKKHCEKAETAYLNMIEEGYPAQIARDILPIGVKAEIVVSTNIREWRHILKLRTDNASHPIMHELMRPLLKDLQNKVPILFDDITY